MDRTIPVTRNRLDVRSAAFTILCLGITFLIAMTGCSNGSPGVITNIRQAAARRDMERADRLFAEQKESEAVAIYQALLKKDPGNPAVNARMGRVRFQSGQYEEAVLYFRAALKSDPNCFHYALCLAQSQARLATTSFDRDRLMEAAARAYRYAQSLDPENITAIVQLAMCYREQGDFTKAIQTLNEATQKHPNAAEIHVQLGEIYHSQNQFDRALDEYRTALKLDPRNLAAHNGCGIVNTILAQSGGVKGSMARERAVAHFRRSLQLNGQQPQVRGMLDQLEPYQWKAVTVAEDAPEWPFPDRRTVPQSGQITVPPDRDRADSQPVLSGLDLFPPVPGLFPTIAAPRSDRQ